jgi:2',3'-cyclic-nucleotide 2'-phosphodiesterase (5'-nucleotidase family)
MHKGRQRGVLLGLVVLLLSAPAVFGKAEREQQAPALVAVNMADTHSAYDAYPKILTAVDDLSERYNGADLVFLFNGDLFELGNAAAKRSDGEADWAFLRRLRDYGPVIVNIGNHEFDFVSPKSFVRQARQHDITVIGNISDASGTELAPATANLAVGGQTIRVVGIATDQMNTYPEKHRAQLQIPAPVEWSRNNYTDLVTGADHSILLSHAGLVADRSILEELPEDTLFAVGGHDHLVLRQSVSGIPYMHNGFRGERFNVTEVYLSGSEPRLAFDTLRTAEVSEGDAKMADTVAEVRNEYLTEELRAPVGTVPQEMSVREAAFWSARTVRDAVGADVAFLNHTSFGSGLAQGALPKYRFDQFMRFDNDVMRAEVDAATLRTILEHSNQHVDTPLAERSGDFLYATEVDVSDGETYDIATSSWVALEQNQQRYLGTTDIDFTKVEGVTTKGILTEAMNR